MSSFGEIVLNYGDYLIRESEMRILESSLWLNDVLIGFYFEYLSTKMFPIEKSKALFVGPEVSQFIKLSNEDPFSILGETEAKFIFFPINNSNDPKQNSEAGSHWSLLVYSVEEGIVAHFDSSPNMNENSAKLLFKKIISSKSVSKKPAFVNSDCCAQENSYDCGVHVLTNAESLAQHILNGTNSTTKISISSLSTPSVERVRKKRREMLDLIKKLIQSP